MTEQHEMILEVTHASGMQGWRCPDCGRRILLLVPPDNDVVVIDPGDQYASHFGGTGGLRMGAVQVREHNEELNEFSDERLSPWIEALENLDLDW